MATHPTRRTGARPAGRGGGVSGRPHRTSSAGSGAGSGARPPQRRRTGGVPRAWPTGKGSSRSTRRVGAVTTRAAVLAVIACALVLSLTYPLRSYVSQRAEIRSLEQARVATQTRVDDLAARRERWDDPAYVEAQARARLRYVRPGETSYIVIAPGATTAPKKPARRAGVRTEGPWYEHLWDTVEVAGQQPKAGPDR